MDKYERFYQMIRKWTLEDFSTPGIKAEVIIDMLLSEFIGDIVHCGLCAEQQKKGGEKSYRKEDFYLLAKEFPVLKDPDAAINPHEKNKNGLRNSKVDYLVVNENEKKLYLVELKTTKESFSLEQFKLYNLYKGKTNTEKMMKCFTMILNKYVTEKDLLSNKNPAKLKGSKKYVTVVRNIQKLINENGTEKLPEYLLEKYGDFQVEIIYVSLEKLLKVPEDQEAHFIIVEDIKERLRKELEEDKKNCWILVEDILNDLMADTYDK